MYEVLDYYPKEIVIGCVIIMSACAVTYPLIRVVYETVKERLEK